MPKITKRQYTELNAELLAIPYVADLFLEELGLSDISEVKRHKFSTVLALARSFREYAYELSKHKERCLQSKSRASGRDIIRRM